jgi:hypothetical protein
MGYMMLTAPCLVCKRVFCSNPNRVPSMNGEPVCGGCMEIVNEKRIEMGLPPHPIHPDAYNPEPDGFDGGF